jgi:hypothetical protein
MSAFGDFATRVRGYFGSAGRGLTRSTRRTARDVVVTVEERPDIGPIEVDLPYPLPTREDPLAYLLFNVAGLTLVISLALVISSVVLLGYVPPSLVTGVGATAIILAFVGNLTVIAGYLEKHATSMLRPLVGAGIPLLSALHYWFNPVVAVLAVVFVLTYESNNWLMPIASLVLLAWAVTGLLLKLPKDSPWNGHMLKTWAGTIHRRPFVYIALIALVSVGLLADLLY